MAKDKNVPQTSKDAFKSITQSQLNEHYSRIISSLQELKTATAEKIGEHSGMEHLQVTRRISELERKGIVWRPGGKIPTKTGRMAMLIQLTSEINILVPSNEKAIKKGKSVAEYSRNIQQIKKQINIIQSQLPF